MYKAWVTYTEEACLRLALVQDKCYGKTRLIVRVILTMIPFIIAYFVGFDKGISALLIALGVIFFYSTNYMYERDASKAYHGTPEQFRRVDYYFHNESFSVESGGLAKSVKYSEIYSLATDGIYFYLFINPRQAYMLELKNEKAKDRDSFDSFLAGKTGKKWKKVRLKRTFGMYIHDQIKKLKYRA